MRATLFALILLLSLASGVSGQFKVNGFAGAGFVGTRIEEVIETDVYRQVDGVYVRDPDLVRYVSNWRYSWRPSLSTGITFGLFGDSTKSMGVAMGGHAVFHVGTNGVSEPYPAATLHIGTPDTQLYVGVVFTSSDEIKLPNGENEITLLRTERQPNFLLPKKGKRGAFYFGIVIKNIGINTPNDE